MTLVGHKGRTATIECLHQGQRLIWTDNSGELLSPGRRSGVRDEEARIKAIEDDMARQDAGKPSVLQSYFGR